MEKDEEILTCLFYYNNVAVPLILSSYPINDEGVFELSPISTSFFINLALKSYIYNTEHYITVLAVA